MADNATPWEKRNERFRARGYESYNDYRRKMERGEARAVRPDRLTSRRSIESQEQRGGIFGAALSETEFRSSVREQRIESALRWSNWHSRSKDLAFSPERARKDEDYLNSYMQALVMDFNPRIPNYGRLTPSDDLRHLLVDVLGIMTADQYEARYGEGSGLE